MVATERERGELRRWIGFSLIAVMAFGAMAGGAAAHTSDDHGEVTIHDDPEGPPANDIECEFWVKGHNMTSQEGEIWLSHRQADFSGGKDLGDYEGVPNDDGTYDFMEGPFNYSEGWGHHDVHATTDPRESREDEGHRTNNTDMNYTPCPEDRPPDCPENVQAQARQNGDIHLTWNASENADEYTIYRTEAGSDRLDRTLHTNDTEVTDQETEPGTTYEYSVRGQNDEGISTGCEEVEVTAIPFFGNPALVAMAALGSVGAIAAARVRRG